MAKRTIQFARPDIGEAEIQEVVDTMRSGWLTTGPKTRMFETEFANCIGSKHAIAVNSGTAAMHLALEAMGISRGDCVLTTDYTFTSTAEVVRYLDAEPVFVDIDAATLNMSAKQVEQALISNPKIKAIIPVHIAGQTCNMQELEEICAHHGVRILEDAAHAFPATSEGRLIGSIGDATAFSFYATKTLATGEGGMLTTDDDEIAARARVMRLHGISSDVFDRYTSAGKSWSYEVIAAGYKYNLTDIASAIGLHQLRRFESLHARRQAIANRYLTELDGLPLQLPRVQRPLETHAWHLFIVQLDVDTASMTRDELITKLARRGVATSVHFIPLHRHPYWRDRYKLLPQQFPNAEYVFHRAVSLPLYSAMSDHDVDYVISSLREILSEPFA